MSKPLLTPRADDCFDLSAANNIVEASAGDSPGLWSPPIALVDKKREPREMEVPKFYSLLVRQLFDFDVPILGHKLAYEHGTNLSPLQQFPHRREKRTALRVSAPADSAYIEIQYLPSRDCISLALTF